MGWQSIVCAIIGVTGYIVRYGLECGHVEDSIGRILWKFRIGLKLVSALQVFTLPHFHYNFYVQLYLGRYTLRTRTPLHTSALVPFL